VEDDLRIVVAEALVAAFATAAAVVLLCGWPWRSPRPIRVSAGAALGLALGFYAGCLLLPLPRWSPRVDQGRLLLLLFPAAIAVEVVASFLRRPWQLAWLLRAAIAVSAPRILLHDSVYLEDLSGPGTAEWTPLGRIAILACLAGTLLVVWALIFAVAGRGQGKAVSTALALTAAGAAVVTMLSGSLSEGMPGLALAAGLAGVSAASLAMPGGTDLRGALSLGVVGVFALLLSGHFFASLTAAHAIVLFAGLLCCALIEIPPVRKLWPRVRAVVCVGLVLLPVTLVVAQAYQSFKTDAGRSGDVSSDDYSSYQP
jgi:hypothetical protein